MTKEQAAKYTIKRFTNLIDGKVLSFTSVGAILNYYEGLLHGFKQVPQHKSGIVNNFEEECIKELEEEAANYDSDGLNFSI